MIGGDGIITCNYGPESVYTTYSNVEWTYQAPNTTFFTPVYIYLPDGRNSSFGNLKDRATHMQTRTQMKLIIHETEASDDGIYRAKIQGSDTAICQVSYITRGKYHLLSHLSPLFSNFIGLEAVNISRIVFQSCSYWSGLYGIISHI